VSRAAHTALRLAANENAAKFIAAFSIFYFLG